MLVVSEIAGTPTVVPVLVGSFGADGTWPVAAVVPNDLPPGLAVKFKSFAFGVCGVATETADVEVLFQ